MMEIPKDKSKRRRREKLKEKNCQFPISDDAVCNKIFYGTGKSKYCPEHRKRKYRSIIDKRSKKNSSSVKLEDSSNRFIDHDFEDSQVRIYPCALEGCDNEFRITIISGQKVYPKYCPDHRNPYKRKLFIERIKNGTDEV